MNLSTRTVSGSTVRNAIIAFSLIVGLSTCSKKSGNPTNSPGGDSTPPAAITNLAIIGQADSTITLSWTAVGDDGTTGTATAYSARHSFDSTKLANWSGGTTISGLPAPALTGTLQQVVVTGMVPESLYYFAVRAMDEIGNTSPVSNIAKESTSPLPQVYMTSPSNGQYIGDYVELSANAWDDKGIVKVEFYADTVLRGTDITPPYSIQWDKPESQHGTIHTVFARAYDTDNNVNASSAVQCVTDTSLYPPHPVILRDCSSSSELDFRVCWQHSDDSDFQAYEVRYGRVGSITVYTGVYPNRLDTTHQINQVLDLLDGFTYWCVVATFDRYVHQTVSDTVFRTLANLPPPPVRAFLVQQGVNEIKLAWTKSLTHDFAKYRIVRSHRGLPASAQILQEFSSVDSVSYTDMTLSFGAVYDYSIDVVDLQGADSASNHIYAKLLTPSTQGTCLNFQGDYCAVPFYTNLNFDSSYTIEAWVNPDVNGLGTLVDKLPGSGYFQYSLWLGSNHLTLGSCSDGSYRITSSNVALPINIWHHVAVVYQNGSVSFYLNGNLIGTNTSAASSPCGFDTELNFGRRAIFDEWYYYGQMDEIRIWNTARSEDQIFSKMDTILVGSESGLVGYWRLDEGSGDTFGAIKGGAGRLGSAVGFDTKDPIWTTSSAPIRY